MCVAARRAQRVHGARALSALTLTPHQSWFCIGAPIAFGVLYTFGNIVTLFSSMFLCGPKKQLQNMTDKTRIGVVTIFFVFMILTLVAAFKMKSKLLTILFGFCQMCALWWYNLSYIPFARQIVAKLMGGAVGVSV